MNITWHTWDLARVSSTFCLNVKMTFPTEKRTFSSRHSSRSKSYKKWNVWKHYWHLHCTSNSHKLELFNCVSTLNIKHVTEGRCWQKQKHFKRKEQNIIDLNLDQLFTIKETGNVLWKFKFLSCFPPSPALYPACVLWCWQWSSIYNCNNESFMRSFKHFKLKNSGLCQHLNYWSLHQVCCNYCKHWRAKYCNFWS